MLLGRGGRRSASSRIWSACGESRAVKVKKKERRDIFNIYSTQVHTKSSTQHRTQSSKVFREESHILKSRKIVIFSLKKQVYITQVFLFYKYLQSGRLQWKKKALIFTFKNKFLIIHTFKLHPAHYSVLCFSFWKFEISSFECLHRRHTYTQKQKT